MTRRAAPRATAKRGRPQSRRRRSRATRSAQYFVLALLPRLPRVPAALAALDVVQGAAGARVDRTRAHPAPLDSGATTPSAFTGAGPGPGRAEQPIVVGRVDGLPTIAVALPTAYALPGSARSSRGVATALDPGQPVLPGDPHRDPAVHDPARPAPAELAGRPRPRLPRVDAAVRAVDAAGLRRGRSRGPRGGGLGRRRGHACAS